MYTIVTTNAASHTHMIHSWPIWSSWYAKDDSTTRVNVEVTTHAWRHFLTAFFCIHAMKANSARTPPIDMNAVSLMAVTDAHPEGTVGLSEIHPNITWPISCIGAHIIATHPR